jgi:hypothetical protein
VRAAVFQGGLQLVVVGIMGGGGTPLNGTPAPLWVRFADDNRRRAGKLGQGHVQEADGSGPIDQHDVALGYVTSPRATQNASEGLSQSHDTRVSGPNHHQ